MLFSLRLSGFSAALLMCASIAWSAPFQDLPGSIPLKYERQAASDLVYQGHVLLPDQASALYESGKVKDLTDLNPMENSILWKNQILSNKDVDQENIGLSRVSDEVTYMSDTEVPDGFSFIGSKTAADGKIHSYQILLDVKAHNVLLRKALLRKIGYNIPGMIHVSKLRVHFNGAFSKKEFARNVKRLILLDEKRWIVAGEDTDDDTLVLQDVVVIDGINDTMYNLARGYMDPGVVQGRRLMSSLLVPYNLTDIPEKGLNLFGWTPGRVVNTQLILNFTDADVYTPSYEDARWITRRILKLSRHDWEQVVSAGAFPADVGKLLVEKLISRRNYLRETLNLQNEATELPVDPRVSAPPRLVDGKLSGITWPGYASHFSDVDASSPLADGELWGFFKSKLLSNVIANMINIFNSDYMPQTNQTDLAISIAAKKFSEGILRSHGRNIPVSLWKQDLWGTHVIASREIVTGNYLGTDNIVQLADSVGLAADLGYYIGSQGLPVKMNAAGKVQLSLMRTYTHLKPIMSIKKALKEPFRNMMVPWLKGNQAGPLDTILALEGQKEKLGDEEYDKQLQAALTEFTEKLGIGESLIIQTSLAPNLAMGVGYGLARNVQLLAQFQDSLTVLSRIHIYRKDKDTIQIYRDPARFNTFNFALALQARIQVVQFDWGWIKGAATTNFYQLDLSADLEKNPKFFEHVAALRSLLKKTDLDLLNEDSKPWKFDHDFSERDFHFNLLWYRYLSANATDRLRVTTPELKWKDFIRRTIGKRTGQDYESLSLQVLNQLADEYTHLDPRVNITSTESGNPGDTFKGKSVMRQVVLEAQINQNGTHQDLDLENTLVAVNYRWKGWDISTEKAQKIIQEITDKYGHDIFPKLSLNDTKKIQFYAIEVKTSLYQAALESLMNLTEEQWRNLLMHEGIPQARRADQIEKYLRLFVNYQRSIQRALAKSDSGEAADKLAKLVNLVESTLTFPGFVDAVGGVNNLYLVGDIRGFRIGDENGDQPIFSRTLGEIGSNKPFGPLAVLQNQIGVSEGELLIYWLLQQL
jgi:hypothetical protein